jgi:hypothetical protein
MARNPKIGKNHQLMRNRSNSNLRIGRKAMPQSIQRKRLSLK